MSTIAEPRPGVAVPAAVAPAVAADEPSEPAESSGAVLLMMRAVTVVAIIAGLAAAVVGFALSYGALVSAAEAWGYASWEALVYPLGVDGLVIALYSVDLVLTWRRMPRPVLRLAAHAVTAVTIGLNMAAAASGAPGSPGLREALGAHPARLLAHAAMPVAYVLLVEAARHLIVRTARLEVGADTGTLSLADWTLRFPTTWRVFRHAKTWPCSYAQARLDIRERAIHRVWLRHREEIEAGLKEGRVGVLDRLPELLAPYGVSVEEARALPDLMRRREAERLHNDALERQRLASETARQTRELEHQERLAAAAADAAQLRADGELAVLRAQMRGATGAAEHRAAAEADTAGIEAAAAKAAAERAASETQRLAEAEERAEETARTAALRRRATEDAEAAERAERAAAKAAAERAELAERAERAAAREAAERRRAAEDADAAEHAELVTAERRAARAALERRAAEDEDIARLGLRDRAERRVARMILAAGGADPSQVGPLSHDRLAALVKAVPLSEIEAECGVSQTTAGDYRAAAAVLIANGYRPPAP
ncbi:DUF2637 domain-containing protein [Streptomyces jumonjinensis]|uniref:DUF2637 domain-containing protein n=1 Tax=Streptomyces jumonjinensis TaxID=1945 RepID=UPI0037912FA6